jgi:hypothetical protein
MMPLTTGPKIPAPKVIPTIPRGTVTAKPLPLPSATPAPKGGGVSSKPWDARAVAIGILIVLAVIAYAHMGD